MTRHVSIIAFVVASTLGCGDDSGDDDQHHDAAAGDDAGKPAAMCEPRPADNAPDPGSCEPLASDYSPCADDKWEACISDDGEYHRIEQTISSIARVRAFEEIAALLFDAQSDASSEDFLSARSLYQEDEGLDSRVVRRYDPHFLPDEDVDCTAEGAPEQHPDYCVGPARMQPLILEAFNAGVDGDLPRVQSARIEAGLLWFFYVSAYKESYTCADAAKDCDSSYAYYTGGEDARGGLGLARYIEDADPYAHDRAWDGLLAVRCWRDLDDGETASDLELRDRARDQYDHALRDGVAAVVADRLEAAIDASGDERANHLAFSAVLGAVVDVDVAQDADDAAIDDAIAELEAEFDCP